MSDRLRNALLHIDGADLSLPLKRYFSVLGAFFSLRVFLCVLMHVYTNITIANHIKLQYKLRASSKTHHVAILVKFGEFGFIISFLWLFRRPLLVKVDKLSLVVPVSNFLEIIVNI